MPVKEKIPIEGLLECYEAALTQTGYSITTRLLLVKRAELMIRRHLNIGLVYFDQTVINHYVSEIDDKYFKGNKQIYFRFKTHCGHCSCGVDSKLFMLDVRRSIPGEIPQIYCRCI